MPPPNLDALIATSRYPGRFEGEHTVIRDWLLARGADYDAIEFNVPLGVGPALPPNLHAPYIEMAKWNGSQKADIVAYVGRGVVLIEAKREARSNALGQLFTYRALWEHQRPDLPVLALEVICRRVNQDNLNAFIANGVAVRVFAAEE